MYESPIEKIYGDIQSQIIKQDEEHMMYAVNQAIGYTVDKEELIKALQYDREQYTKGYSDCKNDMLAKVKQAREEILKLDDINPDYPMDRTIHVSRNEVLEILDKLIAESETE